MRYIIHNKEKYIEIYGAFQKHGANMTFVLWGIIYGVFVISEKLLNIDKKLADFNTMGRIAYRLLTLLIIMFLWVLFRAESIFYASDYFMHMLDFGARDTSEAILYASELKWSLLGCTVISLVPYEIIDKKERICGRYYWYCL